MVHKLARPSSTPFPPSTPHAYMRTPMQKSPIPTASCASAWPLPTPPSQSTSLHVLLLVHAACPAGISTFLVHTPAVTPQSPTTLIVAGYIQATFRNEIHWPRQRGHHGWHRRGRVPGRRKEHHRVDGVCPGQLHRLHRDMAGADSSGCGQSPVLRQRRKVLFECSC